MIIDVAMEGFAKASTTLYLFLPRHYTAMTDDVKEFKISELRKEKIVEYVHVYERISSYKLGRRSFETHYY